MAMSDSFIKRIYFLVVRKEYLVKYIDFYTKLINTLSKNVFKVNKLFFQDGQYLQKSIFECMIHVSSEQVLSLYLM